MAWWKEKSDVEGLKASCMIVFLEIVVTQASYGGIGAGRNCIKLVKKCQGGGRGLQFSGGFVKGGSEFAFGLSELVVTMCGRRQDDAFMRLHDVWLGGVIPLARSWSWNSGF